MSMELKSQINKAEEEKDIKTLEEIQENAEIGFEGEIAGLAKAALDRLHGKVEDAEKTPNHVVEKLGEEKVEEITVEVDKEIESLKEKTEGEIEGVVGDKATESLGFNLEKSLKDLKSQEPKTKNLQEIQNYINKIELQEDLIKELFKEKVLSVFKSATEDDLIKIDRAFGFTPLYGGKKWEELSFEEKNKNRQEVFEDIAENVEGSFGDFKFLSLVSTYSSQEKIAIENLSMKYKGIFAEKNSYEKIRYLLESVNRESSQTKKEEIIDLFKKRYQKSNILSIYESLDNQN